MGDILVETGSISTSERDAILKKQKRLKEISTEQ